MVDRGMELLHRSRKQVADGLLLYLITRPGCFGLRVEFRSKEGWEGLLGCWADGEKPLLLSGFSAAAEGVLWE